jgi:hypothetical protein
MRPHWQAWTPAATGAVPGYALWKSGAVWEFEPFDALDFAPVFVLLRRPEQ